MTHTLIKFPDEDHPIVVRSNPSRVVVRFRGKMVADTVEALTLCEASLPAVNYIPREDVRMEFLDTNEYRTYCPYKGYASSFDLLDEDDRRWRAAWSYELPHDAVAQIAGCIAFVVGQAICVEEWERGETAKA